MSTTREATWSFIGTNTEDCRTIDEVLQKAKLDYNVVEKPITCQLNDSALDTSNYKAIIRESDGHVYNIAKQSYTVVQNRDAFAALDDLQEEMKIVKAGETNNGFIYLIAELPSVTILNDSFRPNVILQTSHNAEFGLRYSIVPLRICCKNQFNIAFKESRNTISIKHTTNAGYRIEDLKQSLRNAADYMHIISDKANRLAATEMKVEDIVDQLFPIYPEMNKRALTAATDARDAFVNAYNQADNSNFRGTAWGIMNAATDYFTHKPSINGREEGKFIMSITDPAFLKRAVNLIEGQTV